MMAVVCQRPSSRRAGFGDSGGSGTQGDISPADEAELEWAAAIWREPGSKTSGFKAGNRVFWCASSQPRTSRSLLGLRDPRGGFFDRGEAKSHDDVSCLTGPPGLGSGGGDSPACGGQQL